MNRLERLTRKIMRSRKRRDRESLRIPLWSSTCHAHFQFVLILPVERRTNKGNTPFYDVERVWLPVLVVNDVIYTLLFEMIRTPLSSPTNVDLGQGRVIFENSESSRNHIFVEIFVSFRQRKPFEKREVMKLCDELFERFLKSDT